MVFVVVVVSDELDFTCDFGLSDIDECLQTPNPCAYQCRNVPGSFRCQCPPGTVLLGDGRSCAGLEGRQPFGNRTRVRARLRPQLVSSLGRPILSRSTGASRITRQSCPAGYTHRDGTCVGESKSPRTAVLDVQHPRPAETKRMKVFGIFPTTIHLFFCRPLVVQMWTSASSGSPVNTSAGTQRAASRACVQQDISSDPTAAAVKVTCLGPAPPTPPQQQRPVNHLTSLCLLHLQTSMSVSSTASSVDTTRCASIPGEDTSVWTRPVPRPIRGVEERGNLNGRFRTNGTGTLMGDANSSVSFL